MRPTAVLALAALAAFLTGCGGSPSSSKTVTGSTPLTTAPAATTTPATSVPTTSAPTTSAPTTSAPTTSAPTTTATTVPPKPTTLPKPTTVPKPTTTWVAAALAPTASQAAYDIVGAWSEHDRTLALKDATPSAVSALFANPYPAGGPQYRGCSAPPGNQPSICVWRSGNNLLSLTVSPFSQGWAVTGALMET